MQRFVKGFDPRPPTMMNEKLFPVMADKGYKDTTTPRQIPWSMAERAYESYVRAYGRIQSLERIAARGGFWSGELDVYIPGWRDEMK